MAQTETVTLGGGCFWCLEAVYDEMEGVVSVESGYMGGHVENPTYQDVCTGRTGHIEVVRVTFDPSVTSFREILEVFFAVHDPTSRDRQGNDVGSQYRSAIFYHDERQRAEAERMIRELGPGIVTELRQAETFYLAEDYHQEYFANHPNAPYCAYVVAPKVAKFRAKFGERVKR
ncbi:MAG TPA: peptide-methionine (S)-S-oxide reductase MsrA [Bryobacteraceae bacterium]|jgi:peptide-methionine (S)-S-oxide reductase|nr:peptide-methionine (S)-S-oxide reductase MsrA [Bryobacteraceae bacterium]